MKIKYEGPHPNIFDCPGFSGIVYPGDIIEVPAEVFDRNRHRTHNGAPIWVSIEAKPKRGKVLDLPETEAENE